MEETDLYSVLGLDKTASKSEIKKAYHKKALSSHPDKVAESERETAEVEFKAASQAYEILYDDEKRAAYDQYGMAAFGPGGANGAGADVDINDIFSMFGMGGSGGGGRFGRASPQQRRSDDEEQAYEVSLEDLYRGKTVKFASTKNIICGTCSGSGGKENAVPKECSTCQGKGFKIALRQMGSFLTQETVACSTCNGKGSIFKDKDKCKKCKGERVVEARKMLELYIPRGSKHGDKIVIAGEADQVPGTEPGDIIFILSETEHETFTRRGNDLLAKVEISLRESLCGFSKILLKHLDGRGIQITHPAGKVIKPDQTLIVKGEGMPIKKSDAKGDLFLHMDVVFPDEEWMKKPGTIDAIAKLLPDPEPPVEAEITDDVEYEADGDIDEFGAHSHNGSAAWEDVNDHEEFGTQAQCAQQ